MTSPVVLGRNQPAGNQDPGNDVDPDDFPDLAELPINVASAPAPGSTPPPPTSTGGTFANTAETIAHAGSGLVFVNTYGANVSATFRNEIVAAENYFQTH